MLTSFFKKSETDLKGHPFKKLYESTTGAQLIDVRTAEEVFTGPIAGATNIDYMSEDFEKRIKALDASKTYFVYCRSGGRSSAAVKQMQKIGLKAYNLVGGISAWPR